MKLREQEHDTEDASPADGDKAELNLALYPDCFMDDFVEGYDDVSKPYISVKVVDDEVMSVLYGPYKVKNTAAQKL